MADWSNLINGIFLGLLLLQVPAAAILLSRLLKGPSRHPPLIPRTPTPDMLGSVSVVVPTLNEAERINPCLAGLSRQSYEVREIAIVDSNSQDGTRELVKAAQQQDPRFQLMTDDPLPPNWVGRPWALHNGFLQTSEQSKWFLGVDADTQPQPGLVASLVQTAETEGYDLVSLSPQFILKYPGESWLQPALLMTLLYRFDSAGVDAQVAERVMANGQCFLCRRSVLATVGGYTSARNSFCDDVTLARNIAASGFKVGFLDGAKVFKVRMYEGARETWQEWGRSLDLKDASPAAQLWCDLWLLFSVQALPLLVLSSYFLLPIPDFLVRAHGYAPLPTPSLLLGLNAFLLAIRFALLFAIAPSYDRSQAKGGWLFWLSPLADPLAVLRIFLSAFRTPTQWRGRSYHQD
ncbi:2'-O-glycosyltransferase CruG [Chroococcidiopsis thermalis]|uniref:Glycosyl transferase family 2 n=1 Tax=Chroococcidiopsis thermalis (strain PCC 7203) TaxID=251229 RepID=K9TV40_CHRTP|nr:glycosyltransferase family 2 protein [Chroococcidiopsis thermalis]AFY86046.1 glycosyl transferase family 2 [Chroococcidiopsis thermalis PCC 7203]